MTIPQLAKVLGISTRAIEKQPVKTDWATQKIEIDLDDGVKVNYPKFGKALKKVAGLN